VPFKWTFSKAPLTSRHSINKDNNNCVCCGVGPCKQKHVFSSQMNCPWLMSSVSQYASVLADCSKWLVQHQGTWVTHHAFKNSIFCSAPLVPPFAVNITYDTVYLPMQQSALWSQPNSQCCQNECLCQNFHWKLINSTEQMAKCQPNVAKSPKFQCSCTKLMLLRQKNIRFWDL